MHYTKFRRFESSCKVITKRIIDQGHKLLIINSIYRCMCLVGVITVYLYNITYLNLT